MRATRGRVLTVSFQNQELIQLDVPKHLDRLALVAPALAAFAVGSLFAGNWRTFLFQANATAFGSVDPVFGRDISFYVFSLPVLEVVGGALTLTIGIALLAAAAMYFLKGALLFTGRGISAERAVSVHLSVLGSLLFLALAFNTFVGMHAVLSSTRGLVAGATYVDVNARLPLMNPQIGLAVVAAALILANIFVRRTLLVVAGVGAYLAVAVVAGVVYPALLHKFVVAPNELVKETPYIRRNIAATRKAFGLDAVEERNISGQSGLVREDVERNAATIANIRLWDHRPLLDTFSQVQEIRTYYDFTTVSNDRYLINGEYRQTMLSPRELSSDSIPTKNWINETLTFTHGYGVTLGPVTQVTPEGLPVLLVKDIPPVSTAAGDQGHPAGDLLRQALEQPRHRQHEVEGVRLPGGRGQRLHGVRRRRRREDRLAAQEAGVHGPLRLDEAAALERHHQPEPGPLPPEHRRAGRAGLPVPAARQRPAHGGRGRRAPGLDVRRLHGERPLPLRAAGRRRRQLHQELGEDHRRRLRREPEVLPRRPRGPDRADHRRRPSPACCAPSPRCPRTCAATSATRWTSSGCRRRSTRPTTWRTRRASTTARTSGRSRCMGAEVQRAAMEPYYTIMKLPGEKREEFILMLPFNPKKKDNLSAWMAARSDGDAYGKMVVYRFPKDRLVYGPKQIVARINQDTEISRQVSLWDQRGSQVMQGTLLVIPVENSLIYVQPLYLRAESGKIPELKRVIVAYENRIAMEETLERALARIFGEGARRGGRCFGDGRRRDRHRGPGRCGPAAGSVGRSGGARPGALRPGAEGPARGQLGPLRRGDREARGDHREDAVTRTGTSAASRCRRVRRGAPPAAAVQQGGCEMKCPTCTTVDLVMSERQGIEIDYCPTCRGVWLDRGELDKIIERAAAAYAAPPQPQAAPRRRRRPFPSRRSRRRSTGTPGRAITMTTTTTTATASTGSAPSSRICSTEALVSDCPVQPPARAGCALT